MPKFQKAVQDIAIKSAKNGGPDTQDILTALVASHEDGADAAAKLAGELKEQRLHNEEAHEQIVEKIGAETAKTREAIRDSMEAHMKWTEGNMARLAVVEKLQLQASARSADDPSDAQFTEHRESAFPEADKSLQDVLMGWRFGKWVLGIVFIALIGWGLPFWADSCASKAAEKSHEPAIVHTIAPTEAP